MFLHQYILCDSVLFDHYVASVVSQGLLCAIFAFYVAVSKIDAGLLEVLPFSPLFMPTFSLLHDAYIASFLRTI